MQLNNLHSVLIPKLPRYFHASAGISSAPTAFPHFIPLSAVSVSSSLMFRVIAWLGSLSSVSTLWFSLFISMLKYWPHRSLKLRITSTRNECSDIIMWTTKVGLLRVFCEKWVLEYWSTTTSPLPPTPSSHCLFHNTGGLHYVLFDYFNTGNTNNNNNNNNNNKALFQAHMAHKMNTSVRTYVKIHNVHRGYATGHRSPVFS